MRILDIKEQKIISGAVNRCVCSKDTKGYLSTNYLVDPTNKFIDLQTCRYECCFVKQKGQQNIVWEWYEHYQNQRQVISYSKREYGYCDNDIPTMIVTILNSMFDGV